MGSINKHQPGCCCGAPAGPPTVCSTHAGAPRATLNVTITNYANSSGGPQTATMHLVSAGPPAIWETDCLFADSTTPFGVPVPGYRRFRLRETNPGPTYQYDLTATLYTVANLSVCNAHGTPTTSILWSCSGANAGPLFYNSDSVFDVEVRQGTIKIHITE